MCHNPQALEGILCKSEALDFQALCITPGRYCWSVYLDIFVMTAEGNLMDAVSWRETMR